MKKYDEFIEEYYINKPVLWKMHKKEIYKNYEIYSLRTARKLDKLN